MKEIKQLVQSRLYEKKLTGQSIGALIMHRLKEYADYPEQLTGYLRHGQFFVKLDSREDKTRWFHRRGEYCTTVNEKLASHGYELHIRDLRIK